eukprot:CAMPEP_0170579934 /NCGR_PEP_ID=MMETSP0224-20130122/6246_1 /TAXON_ID=285029 /ORGANISM="Togula jolla, Strain CCCM 725" /LENGTH=289 /DNA_ID=CAMNT_0010902987 /DNA_START=381 /DNA_END=1250 /DNA_ORIENTATION=+
MMCLSVGVVLFLSFTHECDDVFFTHGPMEGWVSASVTAFLVLPPVYMKLPPTHCLILFHICMAVHIACVVALDENDGLSVKEACTDVPHWVSHLKEWVLQYLLYHLLHMLRRREYWNERVAFAANRQAPAQKASDIVATATAAPAAPATPAPPAAPQRDYKVPPPPSVSANQAALNEAPRSTQSRAPNLLLVRSMEGKVADWPRIRHMADVIRKPEYTLRQYYDDCVASFPELGLFFVDVVNKRQAGGRQNLSAFSGETEYQRTVGRPLSPSTGFCVLMSMERKASAMG